MSENLVESDTVVEASIPPKENMFQDTYQEIYKNAPVDLVNALKKQMTKIKESNPHDTKHVSDCLRVLDQNPQLLDVLVICYILNGGVLLKHVGETEDELDLDDKFLTELGW